MVYFCYSCVYHCVRPDSSHHLHNSNRLRIILRQTASYTTITVVRVPITAWAKPSLCVICATATCATTAQPCLALDTTAALAPRQYCSSSWYVPKYHVTLAIIDLGSHHVPLLLLTHKLLRVIRFRSTRRPLTVVNISISIFRRQMNMSFHQNHTQTRQCC